MSSEPARVLIVEDEAIIAWDLAYMVEQAGYEVCGTAQDAAEAERLVEELDPDVVLMDVRLGPGPDGITAAERIAARHPVPIIFCTAQSDSEVVARMQATRPAGLLSKPVDREALRTTISLALD